MPRKRRRAKIPAPAWERPRGALGRRILGRSPQVYATIGIVALVLVALGVVGFAYWSDYRAGQERPGSTAVQVDDTKYTLRYFTERLKMFVQQVGGAGNQAFQPQVAIPAVTQQLVQEDIVRRFAGEQGVSASEDDIKTEIATRLGLKPDDANFAALFQEEISRSQLTEAEYRQMIEAAVLTKQIQTKLQATIPASAESAHFRQILVNDQATADDIKLKVEAGADFAKLATDQSLDTTTKDKGGDAGWVPRGALDKTTEDALFALEPGKVTTLPSQSGALVVQMIEKAQDREIVAAQKPALASRAFQKWLDEKRGGLKIEEFVTTDRDKVKWAVDRAYKT